MNRLEKTFEGHNLYVAGLPNFPRNFTRDSIISSFLFNDFEMLKTQLLFSGKLQGTVVNSFSGEEPGKIFHEYPEFITKNNLSTLFNACDTTALFIMGYFILVNHVDYVLNESELERVQKAVEYILSHLDDRSLFLEGPSFWNASRPALKVTYWKDSSIINRPDGFPSYPVVYTLAHVQNMCALRCAAKLLSDDSLLLIAQNMLIAFKKYLVFDNRMLLALDELGPVEGISSDVLHSLFYFSTSDLDSSFLDQLLLDAKKLETDAGYLTLDPALSSLVDDVYHAKTIWPFEQAMIHLGAKKFSLDSVQDVSFRIVDFLDSDWEIVLLTSEGTYLPSGCNPQLWTIAARSYFSNADFLPYYFE